MHTLDLEAAEEADFSMLSVSVPATPAPPVVSAERVGGDADSHDSEAEYSEEELTIEEYEAVCAALLDRTAE